MKKKGCLHLPVYVEIGLSDAVLENVNKTLNNCTYYTNKKFIDQTTQSRYMCR